VTKAISTESYNQGIHFIGPSSSFKIYKTSVQKLNVDLSARSIEGLNLELKGNIQFKIKDNYDGIRRLFENFGDIDSKFQKKHNQ